MVSASLTQSCGGYSRYPSQCKTGAKHDGAWRVLNLFGKLSVLRLSQLTPLFSNLSAGLISGLVNITYSLSYAALIFPGELSQFLPFGITCTLITACVTGAIVALRSSLPFIISGPDSNAAAILALIVATIAQNLNTQESDRVLPTIWLTIIVTTSCTGLFLWTLGRLHLGRFIRFIPYPVVGGFLAGLGWLFAQGSLSVMTGMSVDLGRVLSLFQPSLLLLWLPGILLGITLQVILARSKNFLTFPLILLGALICFYAGLALTGTSFTVARDAGLLFSSFTRNSLSQFPDLSTLFKADWSTLGLQFQSLLTLLAIVPITILLNATGLEMATQTDVDLDHELETAGIANLVTGLCSGIVGHFSISRSLLNHAAGGRNRSSGLVAALFCALFLFWGTGIFNYLPRFLFGGLLFYLGVSLLIEWIYQAWFRLAKLDYALVLIMLLTISRLGLLQGVGIGLLSACLLFVVNYSNLRVIKNVFSGKIYQSNFERSFHQKKLLKEHGDELLILRLQGYLFFGTANSLLAYIRDRFVDQSQAKLRFLILDFLLVVGLDSSAVVSFLKIKQLAEKADVTVILTNLSPTIAVGLHEVSVISDAQLAIAQTTVPSVEEPDPEPVVSSDWAAIARAVSRRQHTQTTANPAIERVLVFLDLDRGVEWCENQILQQTTFRRKRFMPLAIQLEAIFPVPSLVSQFVSYMERLHLPAAHCLFKQGDFPDALYFVESGQVSLIRELPTGKTERLGTFGEGTVLGEVGFYSQTPHPATAITDRPCQLYRISHEVLAKMWQENPQLLAACHLLIAQLLAERALGADEKSRILLQ